MLDKFLLIFINLFLYNPLSTNLYYIEYKFSTYLIVYTYIYLVKRRKIVWRIRFVALGESKDQIAK